jgi:hypothetical protein
MFGAGQLYLVIEECDGLTYDDIVRFQRRYRAHEATPLDETIRDKICCVTAHTIVPEGVQYYSARDLHVCSHYQASGVVLQSIIAQQGSLPLCPPVAVVPADVPQDVATTPDEWARMATLVEARGKRNPRGNVVITHGFSGQNMRQKRDLGGRPGLTQYMSADVQTLVLPHLDYLTARALAQGHAQRGGPGRFADALRPGNLFEAVAVAVTRGCEVLPHMDRENDHRDGWNVMGALTFCGQDEKGPFRVGVFGYTRKCVGDYLDWEATQ